MIFTYALICALSLSYLYYVGQKSVHTGAIVIASGTVSWGPYFQSVDKYPHSILLTTLKKMIIPRYQEWITESALYLNAIFIMQVINASVCILTFFGWTGGEYPFLYYMLVGAMLVGNVLITFSSQTVSLRLRKMVAAHNLMENVVWLLNTEDEKESSEEEQNDIAEFIEIAADRETWTLLTTDAQDTAHQS